MSFIKLSYFVKKKKKKRICLNLITITLYSLWASTLRSSPWTVEWRWVYFNRLAVHSRRFYVRNAWKICCRFTMHRQKSEIIQFCLAHCDNTQIAQKRAAG